MGRIDQSNLRTGRLRDDEWGRLRAVEKPGKVSMFIDEGPSTATDLRAPGVCLRPVQNSSGLIIIDYLQLMTAAAAAATRTAPPRSARSARPEALAKELEVPVIALATQRARWRTQTTSDR